MEAAAEASSPAIKLSVFGPLGPTPALLASNLCTLKCYFLGKSTG